MKSNTALWALAVVGFSLITGIGFLVLLAALRNLPAEVNDAALIDGCSRLRAVRIARLIDPIRHPHEDAVSADVQPAVESADHLQDSADWHTFNDTRLETVRRA